MEALDTGATAWMLTSASLVLLMTPALAFFYGGMSRTKSVLNMMMMSIRHDGRHRRDLSAVGILNELRGELGWRDLRQPL